MVQRKDTKVPFTWDLEMYIGSLATSEKQRISVNLCKKNGKSYINIVKSVLVKNEFKPTRGIAIPYHSSQQIAAMMLRAFNEGKLLGYDKNE